MAINGVEIKVGQVWRSRCGAEWLITKPYETGRDWHWLANRISGASGVGTETNFTDGGLFWPEFSAMSTGLHDQDLLFLVSDPDIGTERRKQQEPNSPMRRRDDYPPVPEAVPDLAASPADFAASVPGMLDEAPAPPKTYCEHMRAAGFATVVSTDPMLDHPEIAPFSKPQSALDVQIGGGHYKQFAIQPVEFIHKNGIPFVEGNCIKYLARWRDKGGIEDLKKVKHYIDLLIEMESGK